MKYLPKPNQLQIFLAIIKHGSFRAAAKALNQSQPALTRSINELEKMLGTTLIVRGARGALLTESGKLFEPRVRLVLEELERAVNEVEQTGDMSKGRVALGSSSLPSFTMIPGAIQQFQKRFPQVNINLTEGQLSELLPALRMGKLDFAIGESSADIALNEFIEEPFFSAPFSILAHREHPLAQCTSLNRLNNAKWYFPASKFGYYNQLSKVLFPGEKVNGDNIIWGNTLFMALQMVLNADFLTAAPHEILNAPYLNDNLCKIPIKEPLPDISYSFIYPQRLPLTFLAKTLMDELRWERKRYPMGR